VGRGGARSLPVATGPTTTAQQWATGGARRGRAPPPAATTDGLRCGPLPPHPTHGPHAIVPIVGTAPAWGPRPRG